MPCLKATKSAKENALFCDWISSRRWIMCQVTFLLLLCKRLINGSWWSNVGWSNDENSIHLRWSNQTLYMGWKQLRREVKQPIAFVNILQSNIHTPCLLFKYVFRIITSTISFLVIPARCRLMGPRRHLSILFTRKRQQHWDRENLDAARMRLKWTFRERGRRRMRPATWEGVKIRMVFHRDTCVSSNKIPFVKSMDFVPTCLTETRLPCNKQM